MIRSVIVDDEPGAIANLECYLQEYCPQIEVFRTESKPDKISRLLQEDIDVAFLDIEICDDNIFNILRQTGEISFEIVFVTAYEKYAIKAFDVDVLDYLLKPIRQESIISCYNKIQRRVLYNKTAKNDTEKVVQQSPQRNVILKQGEQVYVTAVDDIVYMEAKGAYTLVCFYQNSKKYLITVSKSLSEINNECSCNTFYKIHRSFIVNRNKIGEIYKNNAREIRMNTGEIIPIARRRWLDFLTAKNK